MMRTITLKELVLEELNRQLAADGRDARVVAERPRPRLVREVVELKPRTGKEADGESHV
jgi:hypothetical protein